MATYDSVYEQLMAYIHPNMPVTKAQTKAFDSAVEAQLKYENAHEDEQQIPGGISGFSIGNYSVNYSGARVNQYTQFTLSPAAYAYLFNAGLLRHAMPVARRL